MLTGIPAQWIALAAALSYAVSGIAAKRGLRYSTPITVTLVSVSIHAVCLWGAVLLTGVPSVSWWVLFLFALTGTLQPIIRLFTYAGIHHIGASRGTTLRSAHPLFSTTAAIIFSASRQRFRSFAALHSLSPASGSSHGGPSHNGRLFAGGTWATRLALLS